MKKLVDLFPAIIFLAPPGSLENLSDLIIDAPKPQGTRKVDRCRVAIVDNRIYIVVDSPEGPSVVFREGIISYEKSEDKKMHRAQTVSDKLLLFFKDQNCGCGSKLRSWNPFGSQLSASGDPDE